MIQGFNELLGVYAVQLVCQVAFVIVTIVDEFPFGSINTGFIVMACILMAFVIVIQIIQLALFKNTIRLKELQVMLVYYQDGKTKIVFEKKPLLQPEYEKSSSDIENQVRLVEQQADAYDELRRDSQRRANH